jgi:type III secretion protein T
MNEITADIETIQLMVGYHMIIASMCMARWLGFFFIFPLFLWLNIPMNFRAGFAFALSLPIWPMVSMHVLKSDAMVWPLVSTEAGLDFSVFEKISVIPIMIKEFFLGILLGFFPAVFFFGFIITGELIDMVRGDLGARSGDDGQLSMTNAAMVLFLTGGTVFVYSGEFVKVIQLFYESYAIWQVQELDGFLSLAKMYHFIQVSLQIMYHTLMLALPFIVIIWSKDILTLFQAKMDKKFHAEDYSPAIKNLLFLGVLYVYLSFTLNYQYNPALSIAAGYSEIIHADSELLPKEIQIPHITTDQKEP